MEMLGKLMLWGLGEYDDKLGSIVKVIFVQFTKAISIGLATFLISLIFCSLDISASIGIGITFALWVGGLSVFD